MADLLIPVIVGVVGHVDHGKTSLVRHLTGIDTDRLPEEKRRGMSIDMGVAPLRFDNGMVCGIVDLPGHTDYLRNMIAGAGALDIALLVVAADDGVMPQTAEHLAVVSLLEVSARIVLVITKTDLVDVARVEEVRREALELCGRLGFEEVQALSVSNVSGEGVAELRGRIQELSLLVDRTPSHMTQNFGAENRRAFRMPVRDVFAVKGFGSVITGIPVTGWVQVGNELELLPSGGRFRVRRIESYGEEVEVAEEHISAALNLPDVAVEDVERGMVLAEPGVFVSVLRVVCALNQEFSQLAKLPGEVRVCWDTAAETAAVRVLPDCDYQGMRFAELKFKSPVVLVAGDRFILRRLSPETTLGGGVVLGALAPVNEGEKESRAKRLALAYQVSLAGDNFLAEILSVGGPLVTKDRLLFATGLPLDARESALEERIVRGEIRRLSNHHYLITDRSEEFLRQVVSTLTRFHQKSPKLAGMPSAQLAAAFAVGAEELKQLLAADPRFSLSGEFVSLKEFRPAISDKELAQRERVLGLVRQAGIKTIARGDIGIQSEIPLPELEQILSGLVQEKAVYVVNGNYIEAGALASCRSQVLELFSQQEQITLKDFREISGTSRDAAANILGYFDNLGLTRRVGDVRVLVGKRE